MAAVSSVVAPKRMALTNVKRGVIEDHPRRILLYGMEGIGKSTFAANAPDPIFICPEDGTAQLDIARFPEPESWEDVIDAVRVLTTEQHEHKTLVFDTADWIEPFLWAFICKRDGQPDIESYGFGKGFSAALAEWRRLIAAVDVLRAKKKMHVIVLAHAHVKTFKNPEGEDYDRYNLAINEKAGGLLKQWCDAVLYASYDTDVRKGKGASRAKATGGEARVVYTQRRAAFDAKNRYDLPDELGLGWEEFEQAALGGEERITRLRASIKEGLARLGEPNPKMDAWVEQATDVAKLVEAMNRINAKLAAKEADKKEVES